MTTLFGLGKVLFAVPVLTLAAWLPSVDVEAANPAASTADSVDAGAEVTVNDAVDVVQVGSEEVGLDEVSLVISNCTYYNNANHTQVVGQFGVDCCNNPVSWGRKSRFYVCGGCFPCIPPPPQ